MIEPRVVRDAFLELYPGRTPRLFRAPGRVNLIGEHTDYNDGFVLPMAINRDTVAAAAARPDKKVRVHSLNLKETAVFELDHPGERQRGVWLDYVEGVAQALKVRGVDLSGADLALESDVPLGGGLSSSAALEISTGMALLAVSGATLDGIELALAGQEAEHTYVGAKSGNMDQLISTFGRRGHALLIDCRSLEMSQIPIDMSRMVVAICDSRVRHELASSEYNRRRAECEQGVAILRELLPGIRALRDVSLSDLRKYAGRLPEVVLKRCRHVISENERTLEAAEALRRNELREVGRLMIASHQSLRDDYEVSCAELDLLVEIATKIKGVAGARMTGGGFGGCTVNLVSRDSLDDFSGTVSREYARETKLEPAIYVVEASDGAGEIKDEEREAGDAGQ